jgi:hypothetical protein
MVDSNVCGVFENGDYMTIHVMNGGIITVPADAPLDDPYDTKTGKGFMLPNAIIRSNLSANAKLAFCVLRSYICYKFGFVFITQKTFAQDMSKEDRVVRKATAELERHGIIRIKKDRWRNHPKLYYYLQPEENWKLPNRKTTVKTVEEKDSPTQENHQLSLFSPLG